MTPIHRDGLNAILRCSEICCTTVETFPISTDTPAIEKWAKAEKWIEYFRSGQQRFACGKCAAMKRWERSAA